MFEFFFKRSFLLLSIILGFFVLGVIGLVKLPKNLFPDANRPQIVVITQVPGVTAQVAATKISKPIEEEIARIDRVRNISSVNVANFSIVKVEFEYTKSLGEAAVDVANALAIVKNKLPPNANPAIYKVGDFTLPVDVVALSPENNTITLPQIRKIAQSYIKPFLLSDPAIGNVEVFGGYQSAMKVEIDPLKAKGYGINLSSIIATIAATYNDLPIGFVKSKSSFYTLTFYGQGDSIESVKNLEIKPNIRLGDIAKISWSYQKNMSAYLGNGKESIAIAIQRAPGESVLDVSNVAREKIKELEQLYPNISFEITDTQRDLIKTANTNMLEALRDAIIYTLLVLLLFLGNFRAIIAAGISIPLVFFGTIAIIWLSGGELNIVIYTAIILALGMLVDDAVVVLENIERHLNRGEDMQKAVIDGTKEVLAPIFAGTVATIAIIFPLMFVGDFPQKIFRPLIETLIIALLVSYFLSITFIPKLSFWLYRNGTRKNSVERFFEKMYETIFSPIKNFYLGVLHFSNSGLKIARRILLTVSVVVLFVVSLRVVMPLIGKDVMPPMDTGIIKAKVAFSANESVESAKEKLKKFLLWLHNQPWVIRSSISFGSEPGVLSLGSGDLPTEATLTITAVNRFDREQSIWELEDLIRDRIAKLPGVKRDDVFDFGATALSTIKAPLDIRIKAESFELLPQKAHEVRNLLKDIKGLTSIYQSWDRDFREIVLDIDKNRVLSYRITPTEVVTQILLRGQVATYATHFYAMNAQPLRLYFDGSFGKDIDTLRLLPISTPKGDIPLGMLAHIYYQFTPAKIERDGLLYSIDVGAYRAKRPVTHITDDAKSALQELDTTGFIVTQEGDIKQLNDSFERMLKAIAIGVVILFLTLMSIYSSARLAAIMIFVLPLAMIGAAWSMLIFHKPSCMPSLVGLLLLFGIIIKNAVLLIDFYKTYKESGNDPFYSAIKSVEVRFRPVMMTAFGTIAGMVPIALEQAVGLERLSPLADVAIGGLLVGTLLTLVYVPLYSYITDKGKK